MTIEPPADRWRCRAVPLSEEARACRAELGLALDRPVVMGGHQAEFWHAGIVAKVLALDAMAERAGAVSAWVVVDQDVGEPGRVRYPTRVPGRDARGAGRLGVSSLGLLTPWGADVVTGRQPAVVPAIHGVEHPALGSIGVAVAGMKSALAAHVGEASRALQVTRAALDLLGPWRGGVGGPVLVSALGLARTGLFGRLVEEMRRDPRACVEHYNRAVSRHPAARMRALAPGGEHGAELALWVIDATGRRRAAFERDLEAPGGGEGQVMLAPRALLMTALLRWGACDLFIHGLGGGRYDPVMEEWLGAWLGVTDLAPAVVVSATRLMPLVDEPPPTPGQVARARWAAHHARHDPAWAGRLGAGDRGKGMDPRKMELVSAVRSASTPGERAARFRALHAWIEGQRRAHAEELGTIEARAREVGAVAGLSRVAFDRTWAFPLLAEGAIGSLRSAIRAAF